MERPVVLIMEDDHLLRRYLHILCDSAGCRAVAAPWGGETCLLARAERPGLIVADTDESESHPGGLEALTRLLSETNTLGIPVIVIGEKRPWIQERPPDPMRLVDFIKKPFISELLLERLRIWAGKGVPGSIPE